MRPGLAKQTVAVSNTRNIGKRDLILNTATSNTEVHPETCDGRADGELVRVAWQVGNRHTPCQIDDHRLMIQRDHVIRKMLLLLGATLREVSEPFRPDGGAFGHGHDHSATHGPAHAHSY